MAEIIKIALLGITGVLFAIQFRQQRPEYALLIGFALSILVFSFVCRMAGNLLEEFRGLQQYLGEDTRVLYAEGCHLYKDKVQGLAEEKDRFKEALIMAEQSDVVVMCLGLDATIEGEEGDAGNEYASGDKLGLMLPGLQEELLEAVAAVGKPVILVLSAGSAIDLSWAEEHVDAIIDRQTMMDCQWIKQKVM